MESESPQRKRRIIILADDTYEKPHGWFVEPLAQVLEDRKHKVCRFDGRGADGRRVKDPAKLAEMLSSVASDNHADALVFDLVWHDDTDRRERGMEVLRLLSVKAGDWAGVEVVIYSKIADEYRDRLKVEFGIQDEQIFDHYTDKLNVVADYFE